MNCESVEVRVTLRRQFAQVRFTGSCIAIQLPQHFGDNVLKEMTTFLDHLRQLVRSNALRQCPSPDLPADICLARVVEDPNSDKCAEPVGARLGPGDTNANLLLEPFRSADQSV